MDPVCMSYAWVNLRPRGLQKPPGSAMFIHRWVVVSGAAADTHRPECPESSFNLPLATQNEFPFSKDTVCFHVSVTLPLLFVSPAMPDPLTLWIPTQPLKDTSKLTLWEFFSSWPDHPLVTNVLWGVLKGTDCGATQAWFWIPAVSLTVGMSLDDTAYSAKPRFPHL